MLNLLIMPRLCKKNNHSRAKKQCLIMKFILFFTCALCISATASVYSQNTQFTFSVEGKTIKEVFRLIEKESEFRFLYNDDFTDLNRKVSIDVKNNRVESILDMILDQSEVTYRIMDNNLIVITTVAMLQEITVTGTVTDETGEPLPGVNVVIKGVSMGLVTDVNGRYTINVPNQDAVLQFSFVGYTTVEFAVGNQVSIDVQLREDIGQLEEVVVVGYGVQKKVNLTGAVGYMGSETLKDRPVANVSQMLQGAMPGLNITNSSGRPGLGSALNIRGATSIGGGEALVLIDGIPDDINRINPDDVESISVLKDASSAAIYGARGAFGVILVTTKSAKGGKVSINYGNNFGWMKPTTRTDFLTNGYESVTLIDEAVRRRLGNSYTGYSNDDMEELEARRYDKTENPARPWIVVKPYGGRDIYHYYGNYDWYHTIYRDTKPTMRHNISIQGGNDRVNYLLSGSYYREEGMLKIQNDQFNSYNFRGKFDAKLNNWLTISNNTSYFNSSYRYYGESSDYSGGYGGGGQYYQHALPAYAPMNPDGSATFRTLKNNYTMGVGTFANMLGGVSGGELIDNDFKTITQLKADFGEAWSITGNFIYGMNTPFNWHRDAIAYYSIEPGVLEEVAGYQNDQIREIMSRRSFVGSNFFFNFDEQFGKHHIGVTGGINYESQQYKRLEGFKRDLLSTSLNDINLATGTMEAYGGANGYVVFGAFFRVNYSYADKYLLEFNSRYDGTSKYRVGDRFGFFPSVSGGWRISEEQFFEPIKPVVSMLKLRASYGTLGNQLSGGYYPYISTMTSATSNWLMNSTSARTNTVTMPGPVAGDLTWEKVATVNFGVDIGFVQNKLTTTFDLFNRKTSGMLIAGEALPGVYGASSPSRNAADMETKGFELNLHWEDRLQVTGKPLSYYIGVSLSDRRSTITNYPNNPNKIIRISNDNLMGSAMDGGALYVSPYEGQSVGEIWGFTIDRYFLSDQEAQSYPVDTRLINTAIAGSSGEWQQLHGGDLRYIDLNDNDKIDIGQGTADDAGDLSVIGDRTPRYVYGINLGASWNGFDISVFMQGVIKQQWYPGTDADKFWGVYGRPYLTFMRKDIFDLIWAPENPDTYFPVLRGYDALNGGLSFPNNKYLQNAGYFRLKNLTIGYRLPQKWMEKLFMQNCRIYVSGENLLTSSKLHTPYLDPEAVTSTSNGNGQVYPFFKTFSFGLDLTF